LGTARRRNARTFERPGTPRPPIWPRRNEGGVVEAALEEALEVLEEFPRPLTPSQAEEALKQVARKAGVPRKTFTRRALEEARRWTEGVLEEFWEALGLPSPPAEVGEALRKGGKVRLWCPWGKRAPLGKLTVETNQRGTLSYLDLALSARPCPRTFLLEAHAGRVEVAISPRLFARKGRAFFRARDPREVKKTLEEVRPLRPLFEAMGLPDLEEALEALSRLKDGEIRQEGPYVLAREERLRVLKRGSYFADPLLEGAFLLGERVVLAHENGVEVVLRGAFSKRLLSLKEASVRWGEEVVQLEEVDFAIVNALDKNSLSFLLRTLLGWNVEKVFPKRSPRMEALIAELAQSEDPLEALKDRDLPRRVALRVLPRS
jgi:hypothetical protein